MRDRGIGLVAAVLLVSLALGTVTGCASEPPPDRLEVERRKRPRVAAVLDLSPPRVEFEGVTRYANDRMVYPRQIVAAALHAAEAVGDGEPFDLDPDAFATWLVVGQHDEWTLLPFDSDGYFGADWRTRVVRDSFTNAIAAAMFRSVDHPDLAGLDTRVRLPAAAAIGVVVARIEQCLLASDLDYRPFPREFELLGELLSAAGDHTLAWRAYRLALRGWIASFVRESDADDGESPEAIQWRAALANAAEGDLAAINLLAGYNRSLPHVEMLKRANWCRLYMQQVRGEVGGLDDRYFQDAVVEAEQAAARVVTSTGPATGSKRLPRQTVSMISALGGLILLLILLPLPPLVRWWRRRPTGTIQPPTVPRSDAS